MVVKYKFLYLFGVFINVCILTIIKYIGINGILSVPEIIFLRTLCSTIVLLPVNIKEFVKLPKQSNKILLLLLIFGCISAVDTYMWNIGLQSVPLNNAMIMLFLSPVITAIMSHLILKERITINIILKFAINIVAISLVYHFAIGKLTIGYFILMMDFVIYGVIAILIKKLNCFSAKFLVFIRFVILLPISYFALKTIPVINIKIVIFISLIVFGYIIERTLITMAFANIPIVEIQPLRYFNVVFSSLLSYLILGENLTLYQIICVLIIIFGGMFIDFVLKVIFTNNKKS